MCQIKADTVLFFFRVLHVSLEAFGQVNHEKWLETATHQLVSRVNVFPSHNHAD